MEHLASISPGKCQTRRGEDNQDRTYVMHDCAHNRTQYASTTGQNGNGVEDHTKGDVLLANVLTS